MKEITGGKLAYGALDPVAGGTTKVRIEYPDFSLAVAVETLVAQWTSPSTLDQ